MNKKEIIKQISKKIGYGIFNCLFRKHALERHRYIFPTRFIQKKLFLWVGDSRIAGGHWNNLNISKRRNIDNRAIGGTRAREWSKRVCIQQIIEINPQYLLIGVGGNDVGSGQSFQSIIGDLQKMIFAIRKYCPFTIIYFHCCLPILIHGKANNNDVREFNRQLKILCEINDCFFIDLFDSFNCVSQQVVRTKNKTIIFNDAMNMHYLNMDEIPWYARSKDKLPVHLNAKGYEYWYYLLNKNIVMDTVFHIT